MTNLTERLDKIYQETKSWINSNSDIHKSHLHQVIKEIDYLLTMISEASIFSSVLILYLIKEKLNNLKI